MAIFIGAGAVALAAMAFVGWNPALASGPDAPKKDAGDESSKPAKAQAAAWKGDPYPLEICVVDNAKLGSKGPAVIADHGGREMRFCCEACAAKFKEAPEPFLKAADEQIVKQQRERYPLKTCPISDEELSDELGEPVNFVFRNRLVRFCCGGCVKEFKKSPQAASDAIAKLDKAVIDQQKATYALTTCPVSGEKLGSMGQASDVVIGGELVRLCCDGCLKKLRKDPLAALAKVHQAAKKPGATPAP